MRSDPHTRQHSTPARKPCNHQINGHLSSDLINIIQTWFIIYCTWMSTRVRGCLMDICATAAHYFQHVILNSAGVHSIFPEPQARDQGPVSAGPPQWHGEIWQDLALSKLHFRQKETAPLQAANGLLFFFPADGMGNRWHHGCGDNGSGFNERWWLFEKYQAFDLCLNLW